GKELGKRQYRLHWHQPLLKLYMPRTAFILAAPTVKTDRFKALQTPLGKGMAFQLANERGERFFVVPRGMEGIVNYVKERYHKKPMYILENGYSPPRQQDVQVQELLNDAKRVEYHKAYLASLARAIRNGADVRGYFVWTLMDNYEWVEGYSMTFGLYYVDRSTLKRIPKLSATWYRSFLSNSSLEMRNSGRTKNAIAYGLKDKQAERI
ncbi:beta-glucosidase, partial [Sarracenia purpurea var. burkii]